MKRPVADILAEAKRDNWPTSSIDAMAKHHLCGNMARDYVNNCFETPEPDPLGSVEGEGGPPEGRGPGVTGPRPIL